MAPLELARETSACLPRAGVGGLRGDTRSLPPPVRYLGPAATRLEGAADDGAYRNVLPHPGAQSRHQTPPGSRVLTAASWVGQWRRGPLRMLRGLQPRCAHISPRASIPQGAAAGVSVSLSRPGVCGGRVRRDGQIGPRGRRPLGCHWPYCHKQSDPVAPWPRAAAQAPPWSPPPPQQPAPGQPQNAALTKPRISSTFGHLAKSHCQRLPGFAGLLELPTGFSRIPGLAGCQQSPTS